MRSLSQWAFIFAGCLTSLYLLLRTPELHQSIYAADGPVANPFHPEDDPRPGTMIRLPDIDTEGRKIRPPNGNKGALIIVNGSCASCSLRHVDMQKLPRWRYGAIYLVFASSKEEISKRVGKAPEGATFIADPDYKLSRSLHAMWTPRVYLADSALRLIKCGGLEEQYEFIH